MTGDATDADGRPALSALDDGDRPVFEAPWQARAFAVAVALSEDGTYEWSTFQGRLVDEIERNEVDDVPGDAGESEEVYYRQWLAALERLLVEDGVVEPGELETRTREFAEGDRDASEWVAGDRDHEHGDGHDHSHGHDHDHE